VSTRQAQFSEARPDGPSRRAGSGGGVGVVFAALAIVYGIALIVRARSWAHFTPLEAITALAFGGLLVMVAVWARGAADRHARYRARFLTNHAALVGLVILTVLIAVVVLAPLYSGNPYEMGAGARYAAPGDGHVLGTDRFGRDVWARVAHGGKTTLVLCIVSVALATTLGMLIGAIAAMSRPAVDDVLMRCVDGMLAFPRILLLLAVAALARPGALTLGLALAATGWMGVARIVRGELRRMRGREFAEAAIASGVGKMGLVWRHLLPHTIGHVMIAATLNAGAVILLESSLSFLGLGVQPPLPSWGAMVFEGRDALATAWWVSAAPAVAITLAAAAFNLVGDGLRDAFETRTTRA
jgi:peptide/nickel transport system permease protein